MQNKIEYLLALEKAMKQLQKYKRFVKTTVELQEIKRTQEYLNSLYYELKKG